MESADIPVGTYQIQNVATKKYITNAGAKEGSPVELTNKHIATVNVIKVPGGYSIQDASTTLTIFPGPKQDKAVWGRGNYPWTITKVPGGVYTVQEVNSSTSWYDSPCSGCNDYIALGDLKQDDHYRWHFVPITI